MLFKLFPGESHCQRATVCKQKIHLRGARVEDERSGSDVLLVSVSQQQLLESFPEFSEITHVGYRRSMPRNASSGASAIHLSPSVLDNGHVLPDLAHAAERDNPYSST
jgi:hypothetical protein